MLKSLVAVACVAAAVQTSLADYLPSLDSGSNGKESGSDEHNVSGIWETALRITRGCLNERNPEGLAHCIANAGVTTAFSEWRTSHWDMVNVEDVLVVQDEDSEFKAGGATRRLRAQTEDSNGSLPPGLVAAIEDYLAENSIDGHIFSKKDAATRRDAEPLSEREELLNHLRNLTQTCLAESTNIRELAPCLSKASSDLFSY